PVLRREGHESYARMANRTGKGRREAPLLHVTAMLECRRNRLASHAFLCRAPGDARLSLVPLELTRFSSQLATFVITRLVRVIHVSACVARWIARTSRAMTTEGI